MFRGTLDIWNIVKNTGLFPLGFLKKFSSFFLSFFKKINSLKRQDIFTNISSLEFPKNSWRIRRILLEINTADIIRLPEKIDSLVLSLRMQFPAKKIYIIFKGNFFDFNFNRDRSALNLLNSLAGGTLESRLSHCLEFSCSLSLNRLLKKYDFLELDRGYQLLSKKILNMRLSLFWSVITVLCIALMAAVFFKLIYKKNMEGLSRAKEMSQHLVRVYEDNTLSDTQKLQFSQDYYYFSREFLKKNTSLTFLMSKKINNSMDGILFAFIDKQYSQRLIHDFKEHLQVFKIIWPKDKNIRGEYYADWLAYLDLLYPYHILVSAIDLQVKADLDVIMQSSVPMEFVDDYLDYLKERGGVSTVLIADDFFVSIRDQLKDDGTQNFFAFIEFLENKELGYVPLDYFFKKSDILLSNSKLPAMFLKENFLDELLPTLRSLSENRQQYAWFLSADLLSQDSLFELLRQDFIEADKKSWGDFLSTITIRSTSNILLAGNFLELLMANHSDFKQLLILANKNLSIEGIDEPLAVDWKVYDKSMGLLYQDTHYLLLNEDVGLAAREYAFQVLSKGDTHLNQADQQVRTMAAALPDPELAIGLRNYLLAPIKFYWSTLLINAKENINQQYQLRVLNYYQQHLQYQFPFSDTSDDADPLKVKEWLSPRSGLLWQFLRTDLQGFIVFKEKWQRQTWLGLGLPIQDQFFNKVNQLWLFANDLFHQDEYHLALSLYPTPSPAIENESLTITDKVFSYQNGPQTWQSFIWQPDSANNLLTIQYASHDTVLKKEFKGSWGLLQFLLDPDLEEPSLKLLIKPENLFSTLRELPNDNSLMLFDEMLE